MLTGPTSYFLIGENGFKTQFNGHMEVTPLIHGPQTLIVIKDLGEGLIETLPNGKFHGAFTMDGTILFTTGRAWHQPNTGHLKGAFSAFDVRTHRKVIEGAFEVQQA